MTKAFHNP